MILGHKNDIHKNNEIQYQSRDCDCVLQKIKYIKLPIKSYRNYLYIFHRNYRNCVQ